MVVAYARLPLAVGLTFILSTAMTSDVLAQQAPESIPARRIAGRVTDANGTPIKGARLFLRRLPPPSDFRDGVTDANGAYAFDRMKPGAWAIQFAIPARWRTMGPFGLSGFTARVDLPADRGVEANLVVYADEDALVWVSGASERLPVQLAPGRPLPTKVHNVPPVYPTIARVVNLRGTVEIEVVIAEDGAVRHAQLVTSAGVLDQAAIDAVLQWRFAPTVIDGVPTPVRAQVVVEFK